MSQVKPALSLKLAESPPHGYWIPKSGNYGCPAPEGGWMRPAQWAQPDYEVINESHGVIQMALTTCETIYEGHLIDIHISMILKNQHHQ